MINKLYGFMVNSTNPQAACEKYQKMTGVKPIEEWEGFFSFEFNNTKLFVVFAPEDGKPFLVFETDDFDTETERLKQEGFKAGFSFEVKTGKFMFYEDSDNIEYGLFQPN